MEKKNYVFIAKSLDGYIADKDGGIDYLNMVPNPENLDMGYNNFISKIDGIIMGRSTFDIVLSFNIPWPYTVPVLVASRTLKEIPEKLKEKVEIVAGTPLEILKIAHSKGYYKLYIDGGRTIQSFLKEDLIDELSITTIPILLGGGMPLFKDLPQEMKFEHIKTEVYLEELVQSDYRRKR